MIGTNANGPDGVRIWVATAPVDMRKSFDGLTEVVRSFLGHDPLSGDMFVFRNRAGHMLKILWWDQDGLAIHYKRLEHDTFRFPTSGQRSLPVDRTELMRLLRGFEIVQEGVT